MPSRWFWHTLKFECHWDRWFLSFFPSQIFGICGQCWELKNKQEIAPYPCTKAKNIGLSGTCCRPGRWNSGETWQIWRTPEKGMWEKWKPRATRFSWILRQTGLYCWENSEMPKSTQSQGTWSRLGTYYPKFWESRGSGSKCSRNDPNSQVR